jgi:hypothetical protein
MQLILPRLTVVLLGAGLLFGCAEHPTRAGTGASGAASAPATGQTAPATRSSSTPATAAPTNRRAAASERSTGALPDSTGIPACDDYLASYVACHRAAAIYKPDQIQSHYEAMRSSLLRDSQDAQIRPNLAARCNSLASQLRQALHGKSCDSAPAAAGSKAGDGDVQR